MNRTVRTSVIALSLTLAASFTPARASAVVHRPAAPAFTVTLFRNGQSVGQPLTPPTEANGIHAVFPTTGSQPGAVSGPTYAVTTFMRNGVAIGKPALSRPRLKDIEISCCPFNFLLSFELSSSRVAVPPGTTGTGTVLYGGATYDSLEWTRNGKAISSVSLASLGANSLVVTGPPAPTPSAIRLSHGGVAGKDIVRTVPSGVNGVHLFFPASKTVAGAASPTFAVIAFTRNGVPIGNPVFSKPNQNDFEISFSCCPFTASLKISFGITARAVPMPDGATGVAAFLYGGATFSSVVWTKDGRTAGKVKLGSIQPDVFTTNLNLSRSNTY